MDELMKLIKVVTRSLNLSRALPLETEAASKEVIFFNNLKKEKYTSDAEAALDLYESTPNDKRYKMLKHRMKRKFYNNLYFLDYRKLGLQVYYQKEHECFSLLHQAYILRRQEEFDLVIGLANRILDIAIEFDFTDMAVSALELKAYCYSEQGKLKDFTKASEALAEAVQARNYEREALLLFQEVNVNQKNSIKTRKNFLPQLPRIIARLEELWKLSRTFSAFDSFYKVSIHYYELEGNFEKITEMTVQSVKWLEDKTINANRFDSLYNKFILVYAHLRNRDSRNGLVYAKAYVNDFSETSFNWFAYMENYFLLALHSKEYSLAEHLLHQVLQNNTYPRVGKAAKERWLLYQLYNKLVTPGQSADASASQNPFLVSLPEYSKDKQGFNVAILILQFIHFLKNGDAEALVYRIESLNKYILTHLKDAFSLRSKLFLKLLMLTVTEDFNSFACRKKGQKYYDKLAATPTPGDAYAEIEIIPYEHLWELILGILEKQNSDHWVSSSKV